MALERVCRFVTWHLNPGMRGWFVKACLDVIENDGDIDDTDVFYIRSDGSYISKAKLREESIIELQPFLLGVLHYILVQRAGKNHLGIPTLDANTTKVQNKERIYNRQLGNDITRTITVEMYEKEVVVDNTTPAEFPIQTEPVITSATIDEQSDDEVINGAVKRAGETLVSAISAVKIPEVNTEAMTGGIAAMAVAAKACTPDEKQTESMIKGIETVASALDAQKHPKNPSKGIKNQPSSSSRRMLSRMEIKTST